MRTARALHTVLALSTLAMLVAAPASAETLVIDGATIHPVSGEPLEFTAELPEPFDRLLRHLRAPEARA